MTIMENIENAKYSIKNNSKYSGEVFFAATNHISATNSSNRNFIPTAANVCIVFASGSSANPLLKISNNIRVESAKEKTSIITGITLIPRLNAELTVSVPHNISRKNMKSGNKYFRYSDIT
jgi:hypothetical protein